jgi:hypothetical protein
MIGRRAGSASWWRRSPWTSAGARRSTGRTRVRLQKSTVFIYELTSDVSSPSGTAEIASPPYAARSGPRGSSPDRKSIFTYSDLSGWRVVLTALHSKRILVAGPNILCLFRPFSQDPASYRVNAPSKNNCRDQARCRNKPKAEINHGPERQPKEGQTEN